ncbi:MAG: cytochrome C oxidase subunit I [Chitinophagales bacterium]|nr:cytochrome C oxidase subunit I [Chitinophagales bacterium]
MAVSSLSGLQETTSYKVVLPFYATGALSLVIGTIYLLFHTHIFFEHNFHPHTLALTHIMALGWGTMLIFGASYQLLPVLIEGKLSSDFLGYLTYIFTLLGVPVLVYGFYTFKTGLPLQIGAVLVNIGVLCYLFNVFESAVESERRDVHAWYIVTAALWLFTTTFFGLLLVFNFTKSILPDNSVSYLALHAHLGLIGWFLMLVIGVGSRLIPMFLISKYKNNTILWIIYALVNMSLISFILIKTLHLPANFDYLSIALALSGIVLFAYHCWAAYKVRIRKAVDEQMKISLTAVGQMLLPIVTLLVILAILPVGKDNHIVILYGFCIFFGWITALIFGMTFKTLPFIVFKKVYNRKKHKGRPPIPKDLFNDKVFNSMAISYLSGFVITVIGIILLNEIILKIGVFALMLSAILYALNIGIIFTHKPKEA